MNIKKISPNISSRKVFVGLSGGVDSAVSAALLKKTGHDVTGVFIKVWQPDFLPCSWRDERRDAMKVAIALDIPFLFFDFEAEYKSGVVDKMISEYKFGRTPNPDVLCNREIKFGTFWREAEKMGADYIATGHYASAQRFNLRESTKVKPLCYRLLEGKDKEKDQSYFLWTLTQNDLSHAIFPIGDLKKSEVRRLARQYRLPVSEKKDSQGICFIGEVPMDEFLSHFISTKPGKVLNTHGNIVGTHKGALLYTIGERHGFEITKKLPKDKAFYVLSKDIKANTITVSNEKPEIISHSPTRIMVKSVNWINKPKTTRLFARIRHRGEKLPINVKHRVFNRVEVKFKKPIRGLSLGQSIVFYDAETCLGGGVMDKVLE
ncbi:MAG: tRNA 2-thiouridine(34) synthase MnmA [Candidatus Zambryskibacteria bacterium]|nr:tRNA 2-thiouridine(34) synthase MnmA [Candidatus Zambryskibacteria bacterium]